MSEPSIPMIPDEIKALIDEQNAKLTPNTLTVRSKTTPLSTSQTRTPAHRGVEIQRQIRESVGLPPAPEAKPTMPVEGAWSTCLRPSPTLDQ
jgi:hypothetical protein